MFTADEINAKMREAIALSEAGSYRAAHDKALSVQGMLSANPSIAKAEGNAGGSLEWTPEGINNFIVNMRKAMQLPAAAGSTVSGGITRAKFKSVPITD